MKDTVMMVDPQRTGQKEKNRMRCLTAWLMAAVLAAFTLCGCGGSSSAASVDMYDLRKTMMAADPSLPDMTSVSDSDKDAESLFSYLSDMDYSKVDHFFLSYSSEGKADEIAVIEVKDAGDVQTALDSLKNHLDGRKKLYQEYDADQCARTESAQVFTEGQYVVLIIGDHTDDVRAAFEDALSGDNGETKA